MVAVNNLEVIKINRIEVRIRRIGDIRKWNEIPPFRQTVTSEKDAKKFARQCLGRDVLEVRWNWLGSSQGYYESR